MANKASKPSDYDVNLHQIICSAEKHSANLKACLKQQSITIALKHLGLLLGELRTSDLNPKHYYELYMVAFDALQVFHDFLIQNTDSHDVSELYELVQYAGNVLPRLYMMITVGSVYLRSEKAPKKEILTDILDMCRGIQNPIRGLFLRYYLSGQVKDVLIDSFNDSEDENLQGSILFVLQNFTEMNKLWVKYQYQGPASEYDTREHERHDLKTLIGTNLVRLSQFENLDANVYASKLLPLVLEQVIYCRDKIAQEYLMEIVIQAFPDEFHFATIDQILEAVANLVPEANVKYIVIGIIERVKNYVSTTSELPENLIVDKSLKNLRLSDDEADDSQSYSTSIDKSNSKSTDLISVLWSFLHLLTEKKPDLSLTDYIVMITSLLSLILTALPDKHCKINKLYQNVLDRVNMKPNELQIMETRKVLFDLLVLPLKQYCDPLIMNEIPSYLKLLEVQSPELRNRITSLVISLATENSIKIKCLKDAQIMVRFCRNIIEDSSALDSERYKEICKLVFFIKCDDEDEEFLVLKSIIEHLPTDSDLANILIPTATSKIQSLCLRLNTSPTDKRPLIFDMLKFAYQKLSQLSSGEVAIRYELSMAKTCDVCNLPDFATDFFSQALVTFEESIADSKSIYRILVLFINYLHFTYSLPSDVYHNLANKVILWSSKLLRKQDQARLLYLCSHLWWQTGSSEDGLKINEAEKVLDCLQKSFKVADSCMDEFSVQEIYIELLNRYIYHFENNVSSIQSLYLNNLISLIKQYIENSDNQKAISAESALAVFNTSALTDAAIEGDRRSYLCRHFERTIEYINSRKIEDTRWREIDC